MTDGNDLLGQTSRPWAKFPTPGSSVTGTVISTPSQRQSRNFEDGMPATWDDGSPKMEVVIAIATSLRDPEIDDDDGERSLVLPAGSAKMKAVQAAMKKAGVRGIHPGGIITLTYVKDGPKPKGSKLNPPKEYAAVYKPAETSDEDAALNALAGLVGK